MRNAAKPIRSMSAAARSRSRNSACVSLVRCGALPATSCLGRQTFGRSASSATGCTTVSSSLGAGSCCLSSLFIGQPVSQIVDAVDARCFGHAEAAMIGFSVPESYPLSVLSNEPPANGQVAGKKVRLRPRGDGRHSNEEINSQVPPTGLPSATAETSTPRAPSRRSPRPRQRPPTRPVPVTARPARFRIPPARSTPR